MLKKIPRAYLYLLIVAFAAVVILFVEGPFGEKKGDVFTKPLYKDLQIEKVARIEVEHLLNGVQLKKEKDQWVVANFQTKLKEKLDKEGERQRGREAKKQEETKEPKWYPADKERIDLSLQGLADLQITSLAGSNPDRHGYFEVNQTGMQVKLFDPEGQTLAHLYIGKTGPAFTESYVRKETEKEVYIANRYLRSSFPPEVNHWRDRMIWEVPTDSIETIQIERAKNPFVLKKENGKFRLNKPKVMDVDPAKISTLISKLAKISASGFEEGANPKMGLEKPPLSISLITNIGPLRLKIGKEKEYGDYFAKKEGSDQIYLVQENLLKAIPTDLKELQPQKPKP